MILTTVHSIEHVLHEEEELPHTVSHGIAVVHHVDVEALQHAYKFRLGFWSCLVSNSKVETELLPSCCRLQGVVPFLECLSHCVHVCMCI